LRNPSTWAYFSHVWRGLRRLGQCERRIYCQNRELWIPLTANVILCPTGKMQFGNARTHISAQLMRLSMAK
jgi:hypothetical protein